MTTKKEELETEKQAAILELRGLFEKSGYKVYTKIEHVSRSGMLRHVSAFVILDGAPYHINHLIARLGQFKRVPFGHSSHNKGLIVGGCGMDMGFELVYNTSRAVFNEWLCSGLDECRSNDHTNGAPRTAGMKHSDTGYRLRQEWI